MIGARQNTGDSNQSRPIALTSNFVNSVSRELTANDLWTVHDAFHLQCLKFKPSYLFWIIGKEKFPLLAEIPPKVSNIDNFVERSEKIDIC